MNSTPKLLLTLIFASEDVEFCHKQQTPAIKPRHTSRVQGVVHLPDTMVGTCVHLHINIWNYIDDNL
jgi:hypothetical protein